MGKGQWISSEWVSGEVETRLPEFSIMPTIRLLAVVVGFIVTVPIALYFTIRLLGNIRFLFSTLVFVYLLISASRYFKSIR